MLGVADGMVLSQPPSLRAGLRGWEYRAQGFAATGPVAESAAVAAMLTSVKVDPRRYIQTPRGNAAVCF